MTQYLPADLFDLPVKIPVIKIKKKKMYGYFVKLALLQRQNSRYLFNKMLVDIFHSSELQSVIYVWCANFSKY